VGDLTTALHFFAPSLSRPSTAWLTCRADNALILGDPWFRQFVIFHDLRHHEVTDKTNNVSTGNMRLRVMVCLCDCRSACELCLLTPSA
jgi:hypothetical protein